jgi:hypothetical protein
MMERKPNEVHVARELLEQLLSLGGARTFSADRGPAPEARLVNVRWAGEWVVLEYDRPVEEPTLTLSPAPWAPSIDEVRRLHLHPGDALVVKAPGQMTESAAGRLRAHLTDLLGAERKVMVLPEEMKLEVLSFEIVHLCPTDGSGVMPCCGRTPFDVPAWDRMTVHDDQITCSRKPVDQGGQHPGEIRTSP